jgi:DNA transformation protein and related proteins
MIYELDPRDAAMNDFADHVLDQMRPWAPVQARRMFGGHGLYRDGLFFALIAFEVLYLKVDDDNEAAFRAAGSSPFVYDGKGKPITMRYWRAPDECLENSAAMSRWCTLAFGAALRAKAAAEKKAAARPAKKAVKKATEKAASAKPPGKPVKRSRSR